LISFWESTINKKREDNFFKKGERWLISFATGGCVGQTPIASFSLFTAKKKKRPNFTAKGIMVT